MPADIKKLEQEVAAFNRRFSVGDDVDYYEVIKDGKCQRLRTRTPAQILSGHTAVVWLEGKSGCVCCSHCFPAIRSSGTSQSNPLRGGGNG